MTDHRIHPSGQEFRTLAREWPLVPMWAELLADVSTPVGTFPAVAGDGAGVLLESVDRSERWGRYSFVAGDPAAIVVADRDGVRLERVARRLPVEPVDEDAEVLETLKRVAASLRAPRLPDLPSLTGGFVGYLAYEAAELLEGHPFPAGDAPCPPIGLQVIDRAIVFDHWRQQLSLVAYVPSADDAAYAAGTGALMEMAETVNGATPMTADP